LLFGSVVFRLSKMATTDFSTLSLHDALPIWTEADNFALKGVAALMLAEGKNHIVTSRGEHHAILEPCAYLSRTGFTATHLPVDGDRKSTRLNSSHQIISYAVFCLTKKTTRKP